MRILNFPCIDSIIFYVVSYSFSSSKLPFPYDDDDGVVDDDDIRKTRAI